MRRTISALALCSVIVLTFVVVASAHVATIIPSKDVVGKDDKKEIGLLIQ